MRHGTLRLSEESPHRRHPAPTQPLAQRQAPPRLWRASGVLEVTHSRARETHMPLVAVARWAERRSIDPEPRALSARVSAP